MEILAFWFGDLLRSCKGELNGCEKLIFNTGGFPNTSLYLNLIYLLFIC